MSLFWNALSLHERILLCLVLFIKISLLFVLPLTGDEAYFIQWGQELRLGYYDHPPVVGWTIWLLSHINENLYFFRSIAFTSSIIVAFLIYRLVLSSIEAKYAFLIALAYLASPISMLSVLLVNDVVLTFFGFLGFYYFVRAAERDSVTFSLLSGIFLGLAFLSKYLSAMLFVGIAGYCLVNYRKNNWKTSLIAVLLVLIAAGENIYFNLNNCWNNILFNLVSRTQEAGIKLENVALFFITIAILVSPIGLYGYFKRDKDDVTEGSDGLFSMAAYIVCAYFLVFMLVSFSKTIGLHWLALPIPFVFLLLSQVGADKFSGIFKYSAYFSLVGGTLLLGVILFAGQLFDLKEEKKDIQFYLNTNQLCDQLPKETIVFTTRYSFSSVLAYHCSETQFHVAFYDRKYGREDDKNVDFNSFDGKTLNIFAKDKSKVDSFSSYFDDIELKTLRIDDTEYYLAVASQFNFKKYREEILKPVCENFYNVPDWLPQAKCNVKEKYSL